MRGELDLLVPPFGRPVHAGDDAHPVDAPEVAVHEGVPGLRLVGQQWAQLEEKYKADYFNTSFIMFLLGFMFLV